MTGAKITPDKRTRKPRSDRGKKHVFNEKPVDENKPRPSHLFVKGQSGNPAGFPKGAKRKHFSKAFMDDFAYDWHQHGYAAIVAVRESNPEAYLRIAASLVPKIVTVDQSSDFDAKLSEISGDMIDGLLQEIAAIKRRRVVDVSPQSSTCKD